MDINETSPALRIGILLIDGFALMSYASLTEPFRAANMLAGRSLYHMRDIPASGIRAVASSGASIDGTARIGDLNFDIVFVVAGGTPLDFSDTRVLGWLRQISRRNVTIGGVSGGPAILARAGLMNNHRMTIHWEHADPLKERYPDLMLERSLYVIDRDRITCAGGIAPLDLLHALIASHHGPKFAQSVSDWFLHTDARPSAGPQRAGRVARFGTTNAAVLTALEAMENTISAPLTLTELATICALTPRQLNRLFTAHLGQSTMAMYRSIRLAKSRQLIDQTAQPLTQIALATGFANSAHFASAFRDHFGKSPTQTRQKSDKGPKAAENTHR